MSDFRDTYMRKERTGWRDADLSLRHGVWGFDCPAVDIDFLMVEYNLGIPVALVEYKHYAAKTVDLNHANYQALSWLATKAEIPFLLVYYWPETWSFLVYPVNEKASVMYAYGQSMTEKQYVASLYHIRALSIKENVLDRLNTDLPPIASDLGHD